MLKFKNYWFGGYALIGLASESVIFEGETQFLDRELSAVCCADEDGSNLFSSFFLMFDDDFGQGGIVYPVWE